MSVKVIETGAIRKLGCGFLFAFYRMAVSVALCEIFIASKNGVTLKTGSGFVQGHWK